METGESALFKLLSTLKAIPLLRTEEEKERFKNSRSSMRSRPASGLPIPLEYRDLASMSPTRRRRTCRAFTGAALTLRELGHLLSCLKSDTQNGNLPSFRYASAGGLYPVQTFVYVRNPLGRASVGNGSEPNMQEGGYLLHPESHSLVVAKLGKLADRSMVTAINRPVFDRASFIIVLVTDLRAIAPIYGADSVRFSLIESGLIAQLIDETARRMDSVGLCHVGHFDAEALKRIFSLEASSVFMHSIMCGRAE